MNDPSQRARQPGEPTVCMTDGWHCLHLFYQVCQKELNLLDGVARAEGREQLIHLLDSDRDGAPQRIQTSVVSGHTGDLALMILDPDPLLIDSIVQGVRTTRLGPVLIPTYSFVSITEVSEYVPTVEQYAEKLKEQGAEPSGAVFQTKVNAYKQRLPAMNRQRLYPDFPSFPVTSFYPMNKMRHPLANWYTEPFSRRTAMMSEHAKSGIQFAGRVAQLITASVGFDNWEWGVTLWSRAPEFIKEIVYSMRYDQASARYAEFGPFFVSYIMSPTDAVAHLRL